MEILALLNMLCRSSLLLFSLRSPHRSYPHGKNQAEEAFTRADPDRFSIVPLRNISPLAVTETLALFPVRLQGNCFISQHDSHSGLRIQSEPWLFAPQLDIRYFPQENLIWLSFLQIACKTSSFFTASIYFIIFHFKPRWGEIRNHSFMTFFHSVCVRFCSCFTHIRLITVNSSLTFFNN